MKKKFFKAGVFLSIFLNVGILFSQERVIISTDIGGTDPDDFQSMIHFLMYADQFETEGLISSPYGEGRKEDILDMLDLYEQDYPKLEQHSENFPTADYLRSITKQGSIEEAPIEGWSSSNEGSEWIIECAKLKNRKPLWILVWGGIEDVAQALHDAPEIAPAIRVYWIGGPNKKWSVNAYNYIASNFPDLFMIEANATYRGFFIDNNPHRDTSVKNFYKSHIKNRGAMGRDFGNYYGGVIKMGDTPSVLYLLNGNHESPAGLSWGGSFVPLEYSAKREFNRLTTINDTVPVFSVMEWVLEAPTSGIGVGEPILTMEIAGQQFDGYYIGNGQYKLRFVTKTTGNWSYKIHSKIDEFDGLEGKFVSVDPWPGAPHPDNMGNLNNWWSDDPDNFEGMYQGAKTIYKWREKFMADWAERWRWLGE
ncbi:nucleoside hydrolase-like domain-containing protein [Autumnicola musiva]|uniref:DUF1593 domain-containing protein n=1 Tax=Autumnicola musiva TaxID=3075589 RepID=A0ABU3D881_9FLAO|nr:nucleoside hydrolase-like domain-containing protein [Zunongwangia sp. F117]MDT0677585.1 DUF1593 domain-containing protein [Zunongwangia sp. F117]